MGTFAAVNIRTRVSLAFPCSMKGRRLATALSCEGTPPGMGRVPTANPQCDHPLRGEQRQRARGLARPRGPIGHRDLCRAPTR